MNEQVKDGEILRHAPEALGGHVALLLGFVLLSFPVR